MIMLHLRNAHFGNRNDHLTLKIFCRMHLVAFIFSIQRWLLHVEFSQQFVLDFEVSGDGLDIIEIF